MALHFGWLINDKCLYFVSICEFLGILTASKHNLYVCLVFNCSSPTSYFIHNPLKEMMASYQTLNYRQTPFSSSH